MANTLRFKRGLVATIPTAVAGEPLFTIDTFDLYIGNGTTNTRFQKYIASGTTSQLLRGDGSLLTMPIVLTSPSNGQVLKYNGTNWVNDSDAGVTGSGTTNYLPKWTSGSALGNSNLINDASGNLGLGVVPSAWRTSFDQKSIQFGPVGFVYSLSASETNNQTFFGSNWYLNTSGSPIYLKSDFATSYSQAFGQHVWQISSFGTAGNAISFTQAMTLDASGNLGLGTTSPAERLHVYGKVRIFDAGYPYIDLGVSTSNYWRIINDNPNDSFFIGKNGASNFALNSSGAATFSSSVTAMAGIFGNSGSGSYSLRVANNDQSNVRINIVNSGSGGQEFSIIGGLAGASNAGFSIYDNTNAATRMHINSSGNVGIGTTDTSNGILNLNGVLDINKDSATVGARWRRGATTVGYIGTGDWAVNGLGTSDFGISSGSSGALVFGTQGGAERMRITSGGNVGIGNASGSAKLHVTGNILSYTEAANTASLFISANNSYNWQFGIGNNSNFVITEGGGLNAIGTERLRITSGGNLLLGSTSDTGEKFQVTGAGIVSGLFTVSGSTGIPATTATYIRFASGFSSPDIGRMYIGDGSGWKFHMSKRLSSTTTDLITFFDNGSVQTSAPTGYAAKPYKLGEVLTGATTADRSIAVEIDGTVYFLLASTTLP